MKYILITAAFLSITQANAKEAYRYHYGRLVDKSGHVEGSNVTKLTMTRDPAPAKTDGPGGSGMTWHGYLGPCGAGTC